jgi:hypothetical protein
LSDCHPYPQDITADPFLVFGGLFSRRVIAEYLQDLPSSRPSVFSELIGISDQCSQELALQRGIQEILNKNHISCIENHGSPRFDRLIQGIFGVEIKLDKNRFDPQFWPGSGEDRNAVEQTRRYLDKSPDYKWALLTNGKVMRLMHRDHALNFLDIWICDSDRSGDTKQGTFFEKLIRDKQFLIEVFERSAKERIRFNNQFATKVQKFWEKYQELGNRVRNVSLVEAVLLLAFYRYLEDCGIFPILEADFQSFRLHQPASVEKIIDILRSLQSQRFLKSATPPHNLQSLASDATLDRVKQILSNRQLFQEFKDLFWDEQGAVDLSDLKVSFFGDAYQLFANKTDINGVDGQYFTGSELARDTAIYFVEEERRSGVAPNEIIYDPFVGSGQLLRALIPFFHILIQGEARDPSIINGMRALATRLAGTDIDENACWLTRLSLTIATSERGKPLLDFGKQIKHADVFSTCFGFTESRWQEELGITGKIKAIITNPPWRRLRQTTNELYTIETGHQAPLKKNRENWSRYQAWQSAGGKERARLKGEELKILSKQHRETFFRCGQGEVNVAISGLDFVDRIPGVTNKKWVVFMPDCFFVGENTLRSQHGFSIRRYYSYPFNDHFEGTDNVMKFGVVFGGGTGQSSIHCLPMGRGSVDVTNVFHRLEVLPIYGSVSEATAQAIWFGKSSITDRWHRGEFDETEEPKRGAREVAQGEAVRGAKKCNNKQSHSCVFNENSLTYWAKWHGTVPGSRVLVRDNRSNTRTQKILWASTHLPGEDGIPRGCAVSNAWNYLLGQKQEVRAITNLMNSPIADLAIRSIASKRHINPKDLNKLGLPTLDPIQIAALASTSNFIDSSAVVLLLVFELQKEDAKKLLNTCDWVIQKERDQIIERMSGSSLLEARNLFGTPVKRRNQIKRAQQAMVGRSRRRR